MTNRATFAVWVFIAGVQVHYSEHATETAAMDAAARLPLPVSAAGHQFWASDDDWKSDGQTRVWIVQTGCL